jgi:methylated-DNA-[protein]-cysteine S-methyltransferase
MPFFTVIDSPVGPLTLVSDGASLTGLQFHPSPPEKGWTRDDGAAPFPLVKRQLAEYFAGKRREFELPLAAEGTEFQRKVWRELSRIPWGETRSYADVARRVGSPKGFRAVGLANGCNPIAIVVPCHRVIGADGSLTGFGGGLGRKKMLLELEGLTVPS